jgi:hypothetical protein
VGVQGVLSDAMPTRRSRDGRAYFHRAITKALNFVKGLECLSNVSACSFRFDPHSVLRIDNSSFSNQLHIILVKESKKSWRGF